MNILRIGCCVVLLDIDSNVNESGVIAGYSIQHIKTGHDLIDPQSVYLVDLDEGKWLEKKKGFIQTIVVHPDNLREYIPNVE